MAKRECSAYVPASRLYGPCANGFPQTAPCFTGIGIPLCCREQWCAHFYEQWGGKPPEHMVQKGRAALKQEPDHD